MNEREIFVEALDKETPEERSAFLDEKCATDVDMRQRIETLLSSHEEAGSFLGIPVADRMADHAALRPSADETERESTAELVAESLDFLTPSNQPGSLGHLGHYEVLEVIGRGGFGIVVRAFDEKLHRVVAIKVMAPQLAATSPPRKRFLREARAAAAIRHDNVVNIFSVDEQPIPYLVMEYIDGPTLQEKLDADGPLSLPDILRLGQQIASGLAAAHAMRLIHRDIKPGNILLERGIEQRVKITDFGLARAADDASMTQTGAIAGTPMYMAPEQACGAVLDHRADLFSLGSVLYVMCSGRPPFRAANSVAVLKRVVEDIPRPIQEIIPETPGWLCDIIAKLHAKQPEDRFESAQEIADLLGRCWSELQQQGQVAALPEFESLPLGKKPTVHKSARKRRPWRSGFTGGRRATAVAILLVLLGSFGLSEATGLSRLTTTIIRIATGEGILVIESSDPGVKLLIDGEQVTISGAGVEEVRLSPGSYQLAAMREGKPIKLDQELVTISRDKREVIRVLLEPGHAAGDLKAAPPSVAVESSRKLEGCEHYISAVAYTGDGKSLYATSRHRVLRWDLPEGNLAKSYVLGDRWLHDLIPLQDGKRLLTAGQTGHICLWNLFPDGDVERAPEILQEYVGHTGTVRQIALSPDERLLVSCGTDDSVRFWNLQTGEQRHQIELDSCLAVALSPDGASIAFADGPRVVVMDVLTNSRLQEMRLQPPTGTAFTMTYSADSRILLVGRSDGLLLLYDIATGNELQTEQFAKSVRSCGFLADGRHYFAGNDDKTLRIFETDSGEETLRFDADSHCTKFTALSPDGRTIASGGGLFRVDGTSDDYETDGDFTVRVWNVPESLWPESSTTETATLEAAAK